MRRNFNEFCQTAAPETLEVMLALLCEPLDRGVFQHVQRALYLLRFRHHVSPVRKVTVRLARLDTEVSPWIAQPAALLPA